MLGLLCVDHGVVEDLCRADDHVRVLQHLAKEVPLLAVPADGHHPVGGAQMGLELLAVMLVHEVNLRRRRRQRSKS